MAEVIRVQPFAARRATLPVLSSTIDWLTTTITKPARIPFAQAAVTRWQEARAGDGFPVRSYAANGYLGSYVDGITWGERVDGCMVRLSGEMAQAHALEAMVWAENISRIDFQVTVCDSNGARDWCHTALVDAANDQRIKAGMTQWQSINSSKGGSTLYIGRRSSSRLLRVYNKTVESEGLWPETSWRYEVEYKHPRSGRWGDRVRRSAWNPEATRDAVVTAFSDYGIGVPCDRIPRGWQDRAPREPTTDERRLAYLRTNIRPMLRKLTFVYDHDVILEALGFYDSPTESEVGYPTLGDVSLNNM